MRSLAFLSVVIALLFCGRASSQTTPTPDSPPKAYTITAARRRTDPILGTPSCTHIQRLKRSVAARSRHQRRDDERGACVERPRHDHRVHRRSIGSYGAKRAEVKIQLLTKPGDTCTATPTFKSDPKPDYLSTLVSFLQPLLKSAENVKPTKQRISLLPAANASDDSSHSLQSNPSPQTRTVVIHYKNPPRFSASAGHAGSLYGKHVFAFLHIADRHRNQRGCDNREHNHAEPVQCAVGADRISQHIHLRHGPASPGPAGRPGHQPERQQDRVEYFFVRRLPCMGSTSRRGCILPAPPTSGAGSRWERSFPLASPHRSTTGRPTASPLPSRTRHP